MIIEKEEESLSLKDFEKLTGATWNPELDFEELKIRLHLAKKGAKLHKKGEMTLEQIWLGRYFQKELLSPPTPDVAIRWIDPYLGWGVFALRDFRKMQFIAEYGGKVRKRRRSDQKNGYCFEYVLAPGLKTSYTIDALDQGGVGRYINHSATPNLVSALATVDDLNHVILYTKEPVAKGTQLCYDYGPDYWSKRVAPILL